MSNKKLSRLLEPNLKFYFAVMLLFAVAAIPVNWQLALAEGTLTILLYFYFRQSNQKRRQGVLQYIDSVTGSVDTASKSTLINSPLPTLVFRPDTGEIIWSNESFLQLAGVREHLFEMRLSEAVPDFQVQWLLSGKQESPERVELNNHRFRVYGSLVRSRNRTGVQSLVATTYWVETTEADHLREVYEASRPVAAILMLDNYEDLMKACEDTQRSAVLAQIDEKLQTWANAGQGILLKTDRNHYLFLFEEQYFQHFVDEKFSILDTVRAIRVAENIHPTLSIGIGKDSPSIPELYKNAKLSLEMALSRGGDQAVVRNQVDFAFYGGRTKATEKRTKVKSRVMANAFRELIADAGEVYIMGHSFADMDAVGAAAGICCAARKRGKQARIVIDREHTAAETLIARLDALPEYMRLTSAVSFRKVLTVDELADIMARHPDVDFLSANVWVDGAYNYDSLHCSLQHMMLAYGDDLEEDYPGMQLQEYKNLTGEDITQHFRAMVQYLADHPEVAKAGPDEPYRYKEMLLNLEEDGLEVLGLWVQGTPDQITALLDEELVRSVGNYDARIQLWT